MCTVHDHRISSHLFNLVESQISFSFDRAFSRGYHRPTEVEPQFPYEDEVLSRVHQARDGVGCPGCHPSHIIRVRNTDSCSDFLDGQTPAKKSPKRSNEGQRQGNPSSRSPGSSGIHGKLAADGRMRLGGTAPSGSNNLPTDTQVGQIGHALDHRTLV